MAQKLLVYQSLWAMERRSPDGHEWSLQEKLNMIHTAGFDGAGVRFADRDYAREVTQFLKQHGMSWQAQAYPQTVDDLKPILEHILEFGADHLNVQPDVRPYTVQECIPLIEGWHELAQAAGVRMHIETHRNRMTTDLFFMLHILDAMPNLRLTGDLSHYVVGREFWYPISAEDDAMMQRIINNCWGFHGRVASREQIQLQISFPQNQHWVEVFMDWWRRGFVQWRQKANQDDTLTFLCELGPPEYAMTGADGYELSDRWQESLTMKDQIRGLWQSVTQQ